MRNLIKKIITEIQQKGGEFIPEKGDTLYCHRSTRTHSFKEGEKYRIVDTTSSAIYLIDNDGYRASFTLYPDANGLSYKTWFNLFDLDYDQTSVIFNQLNEAEEDEFDWAREIIKDFPRNVTINDIKISGIKPLNRETIRPGLYVKRRNGAFIYEIGPVAPPPRGMSGEGFIFINLSNGKEYWSSKDYLLKWYYEIIR